MNDEYIDKLNELIDTLEEKYGDISKVIITISHHGDIQNDDRFGEIESIEVFPLEPNIKIYNKRNIYTRYDK